MDAINSARSTPSVTLIHAAVDRYYLLTDKPAALQAILRRVFFEFLRTQPALSPEEVDHLWVVAELVADLEAARQV